MLPDLPLSAWVCGIIGAIFVGLGKGGIPGMGNITVAMYALVLPDPKLSVGVLLPILSAADITAVRIYKKHGDWKHLKRLLPWALIGLLIGYFSFQSLSSSQVRLLIGTILLGFVGLHFGNLLWEKYRPQNQPGNTLAQMWFVAPFLGVMGGFATMIANAAGPIAGFYFLAMKLPKYAFIGTIAWFFLLINFVKVPFMVDLGIINWRWLPFSILMMPFAIGATMIAPKVVKHINQQWFERFVWFFIVLAGIKLLMP